MLNDQEPIADEQNLARWLNTWRVSVILTTLALVIAAGLGLRSISFSTDYRDFFSDDDPELIAFTELEQTYSKADTLVIVIRNPLGDLFNSRSLGMIFGMTEAAWKLPYVGRVDSLGNYQHTEAQDDDLNVYPLIETTETLDDARIAHIRQVALNEPTLTDRIISTDGKTTAIALNLHMPGEDHTRHMIESIEAAQAMLADFQALYPEYQMVMTGVIMFGYAETASSIADMRILSPLMALVMFVLMIVLLRSVYGALMTFAISILACIAAVGVAAWFGIEINGATAIAPIIIMTLAMADGVHIFNTFQQEFHVKSRIEALSESLRVNIEPVSLTSLTTIVGFLSLNFSETPPFRELGNVTAIGVLAAWFLSLTLFPALMLTLPLRVQTRRLRRIDLINRFGDAVVLHRRRLAISMGGIALVLMTFIPMIEIDNSFLKFFSERNSFRQDTEFAAKHLIGPYPVDYSIPASEPGGISDPEYLAHLERFVKWLATQPEVVHVNSYIDTVKRINRSMNGDDPDYYRLPDSRELAAQYLLLYELSLPYGLDLTNMINFDKSASRVTASLRELSSKHLREFSHRVEQWLSDNLPAHMQASSTGPVMMFVGVVERNVRGMLIGTTIAFLLIALILMFALRSFRLGLVSLLPNFLPVLMTFGLWGLLYGQIGLIASFITATSLGLIVDDTVHILSKYARARREHCLNAHDGVRFSFSHVGSPLLITSGVLIIGFLVLVFSDFQLNAELGLLTAITLGFALLMDFLLLPPILMWMDRDENCPCRTCQCRPNVAQIAQ
jgi:predicted RND superfamily exporter protein